MQFEYVYGENVEREYPQVRVTIERITPEIAQKMLERNTHNRDKKSEPLAEAIKQGQWKLNGASIVFSSDGVLLDGQNRLMAVVTSGKPIDTVVVRGAVAESQITMDVGVKRSLTDYLKMDGYPSYKHVATIGRALYTSDKYGIHTSGWNGGVQTNRVTLQTLYEFTTAVYNERIKPIVADVYAVCVLYKIRMNVVAITFDAFRRISQQDYEEFVRQLRGMSKQCQPVQKLVMAFTKNRDNEQIQLPLQIQAAYIVKTWNAYMNGEEIGVLRYRAGGANPEVFPEVCKGDM